jgi:hypothetical protein
MIVNTRGDGRIRLTKTEKKYLEQARAVLEAVAKHGGQFEAEDAAAAVEKLTDVLNVLAGEVPVETPLEAPY